MIVTSYGESNPNRRAFNPLGIQQDGILIEGQGAGFLSILMGSKGASRAWSFASRLPSAFVNDPLIILADEHTASLDSSLGS